MFHRVRRAVLDRLPLSTKLFLKRIAAASLRPFSVFTNRSNFEDFLNRQGLNLNLDLDVARRRGALPVPHFTSQDFSEQRSELLHRYPSLSKERRIESSIVIPVFNKCDFTFQCLRSLLHEIDLANNEILVVDNASSDNTAEMLSYLSDYLHVITNAENRGFVDACNQGATNATGEYLVFLNNDTLVLKDWLKSLVQTVAANERVGAVGSMFLYPDGSIQEAGSIIWQTGEAHHYGWCKSPEDRRFNFAREVDYCSGASLLIRKRLFDQLGGFDQLYAPAYYEDADLCLGVRSLGYKVVYQPASRVIHFEGATSGTDLNTGMKQYQVINQQKFFSKWKPVLGRDHYPNERKRERLAADRRGGPEVIVFDDRVPTPNLDAGSARMMFILGALARAAKPLFVYNATPLDPADEAELWRIGIETARLVDFPRLMGERNFTVAILSRPEIAETAMVRLRRHRPPLKIIFDMVDVYFVRLEREYAVTKDPKLATEAERLKKLELKLVRQSDLVWCNSSADQQRILDEVGDVRIEVIPTIHKLHSKGKSFADRSDLFYVGNFAHRPNIDGIKFFVREIFPLVKQQIPDIRFHIAGPNASEEVKAFNSPDIHVYGFVPDIEHYFQSARVFVAPVRFGAGVKGKIGDSLSYGLPLVTTSVGAEGMGLLDREQAMIADSASDFASAVVELYRDETLWQRLADNGYEHVGRHFGQHVVTDVIQRSLES